jgi:hypothetical protein
VTFFGMALLTAIGTVVLAAFAVVTAVYARKAFREQSREVAAIEQQVKDEQEVTRQQADLLKVQSGQLELQQQQLEDQRQANTRQAEVLELQAAELRESLEERKREAEDRQRSQAAEVTAWFARQTDPLRNMSVWGAIIRNASGLPVTDVRTFFHYIAEKWPGGDWEPQDRGGPIEKIRVLPPQQDRFVPIPSQIASQMDQVSDSIYVVSIEFTDAAGNHWERDPRGGLNPRS